MARRATRGFDLAIVNAWHTAIFALSGYSGKLKGKSLSDFLSSDAKPVNASRKNHAQGIAFFHRLQARGVDVKITRH